MNMKKYETAKIEIVGLNPKDILLISGNWDGEPPTDEGGGALVLDGDRLWAKVFGGRP